MDGRISRGIRPIKWERLQRSGAIMQILYLSTDPGIPVLGGKGGAVHIRAMVSAFARGDHRVVVVAPAERRSAWEQRAPLPAELVLMPPSAEVERVRWRLGDYLGSVGAAADMAREVRRMLYELELGEALTRRFQKDPPDFIYCRAALFATAALRLAEATGAPLLVELNAPLAAEQSNYRSGVLGEIAGRAEARLLQGADAVLVVSEPLVAHARELGVAPERVHVLPNGIDATHFHPAPADPAVRRARGIGPGPVIGFVGGLRPWHGVETLPELLQRLAARIDGVQLVVVGDGPLRGPLEADLAQRGLSARAVFTGAVSHDQIPELVRQFAVALAPYPQLEHAFYFSPLKLFEYMACGVPVAAPHVGQIPEVVADGLTGLLYPAGDGAALAACCARLIEDADLAQRIGAAGARHVHDHYTWDHNARRAVELAARLGRHGGR